MVSTETDIFLADSLRDNQLFMPLGRCHPEKKEPKMRNQFRLSTSTWLTFFSLGCLLGWLFLRNRPAEPCGARGAGGICTG